MLARLNHSRLLRYAGLFTWAMVGLPLLLLSMQAVEVGDDSVGVGRPPWQGWTAWVLFGICYTWLTRGLGSRRVTPLDYFVLLVLTLSAVGVSFFAENGLGSILLTVTAFLLPWLLPLSLGVVWLILSWLAFLPVFTGGLKFAVVEALMLSFLYAGFSGFIFVTSLVARQQAQARDEQRRLNAELRATRALLAESARVNERTRISRELHDLLGHHLTALSLNLEVANHLTEGQAQEHVGQAHTLAKLLLSDVREAVSQLRDSDAIDMRATLLPLADNVPGLRIDMEMPQPFLLDDPERAHVLLRCTQEIITNAVRHAQAQILRLRYRQDACVVGLQARDDGRGADVLSTGNGLRGMRERLMAYGGTVEIETAVGSGFALRIELPLDANAALAALPASDTQAPPLTALASLQ
ncbi:MAG: histidine kinase [Luteimonas sp.]